MMRCLILAITLLASMHVLASPALLSVHSRKVHGASGTFDLLVAHNVAMDGAVSVEPRAIGTGHHLVFRFDTAITAIGDVSAVDGNGAAIGSATVGSLGGPEIIVTLTGIPDNSRVRMRLTSVNGSADIEVSAGFLFGDTNGSRSITANDINAVKGRAGQAIDASNYPLDINLSGSITAADLAAVKARAGYGLLVNPALLTVQISGTGAGKVTSSPASPDCLTTVRGPKSPVACMRYFNGNAIVTLTATPDAFSTFAGWSGTCAGTSASTQVVVTGGNTCNAEFTEGSALTIVKAGSGAGSVVSMPSGINCGASCSASFNPGAFVLLTATESAGSVFAGWSGACSGTLSSAFVMVNASATCTATFVLQQVQVEQVVISGRVVASQNLATPVAGATIVDRQNSAVLATTDAAGNFQFTRSINVLGPPLYVSISASGHLTRETGLQPRTHEVVADIISLTPPFSLLYYQQLARGQTESGEPIPGAGIFGWRAETMNVYVRTQQINPNDTSTPPAGTGVNVSQATIERVLEGLNRTIAEITRGTVKIGLIESGPGAAHDFQPGWLNIEFFDWDLYPQNYFARGGGTSDSGRVRLGMWANNCGGMFQGMAMHEFGHVFGLQHAQMDAPEIMMSAGFGQPCNDAHFSPAERLHGPIAFSRPRGNADPDRDPVGFALPVARP
ncbi:MAG: hypothetical protein JNK75_04305 [Betaproteobacteria bacterium]|nr:hypothetical protein [Betaproteobacteria bacterium]